MIRSRHDKGEEINTGIKKAVFDMSPGHYAKLRMRYDSDKSRIEAGYRDGFATDGLTFLAMRVFLTTGPLVCPILTGSTLLTYPLTIDGEKSHITS